MENIKNKEVTIKDIAKASGVSFSTVGRALRDEPLVSKKTKDKILKAVKELNYFPNLQAKSLRNKKTKTIGIILNDLKNPFYHDFILVIERILNKLDYTILLCDSNLDIRLEKKNIITMLSKNVEGIVISPINEDSDNIDLILKSGLKAVFIDCYPDADNINYVYGNHEMQSFVAMEYLIKNGHKNILLLNGPKRLSSSNHFLEGYFKALLHYNIEKKEELIKCSNLSVQSGHNLFKKIYKDKSSIGDIKFTAILTLSDLIAIGVYKAINELDLNIPEDYSIIGCDNTPMASYIQPSLTSVSVSKVEVAEESIKILIDQIINKDQNYKKIIQKPKLSKRCSVKILNS